MTQEFDNEGAALLDALRGGDPPREWYEGNLDLDRGMSGSANHKLQCNPAEALAALNSRKPARVSAVLDWCEFYVTQPLHENEDMTPSSAYRPAITNGTWLLAGVAHEADRGALRDALLLRSRADVAHMISGAANGPARVVREHYLNAQNVAHLFTGDGPRLPSIKGGKQPYFAQAGKRVHVREGGSGNHTGPLQGTGNVSIACIVAQVTGDFCPPAFRELFGAARRRWPGLPPFGFSPSDVAVARAFIASPTEAVTAQAIYKMARVARPRHAVNVAHYDDGGVAFWLDTIDNSSTGARMFDIVHADGTHYIGSADTAHRDNDHGDPTDDVRSQVCVERAGTLATRWSGGGGVEIVAPLPAGREVHRMRYWRDGSTFLVGGAPLPGTTPAGAPPAVPPVTEKPPLRHGRFWPRWS